MGFSQHALRDLIEESGVSHKENGNSYIFTCPKCNKDGKLWMLKNNGEFICWYCAEIDGYRGRPEWALRDLLGLSIEDLRKKLYGIDLSGPLTVDVFDFTNFWTDDDCLPPDDAPLSEITWPYDSYSIYHVKGKKGLAYLESRGIDLATAVAHDVHYWPSQLRVLFPVTIDGRLVGYQGRSIKPDVQPKIKTSEGLRRDRALMFWDTIKPDSESVIITEGPVDAIKCALCGPHVATMGKAVGRAQIEMIRKTGVKKIYLGLDRDADKETQKLLSEFSDRETYLLHPPPNRDDLGECTLEEALMAFRAAPRVTPGHLVCDFQFPSHLFT